MRCVTEWIETPPEREDVRTVVYALAFRPDGLQLVAAAGARVFVYDLSGNPVHALKGHSDAVYCLAYAHDGSRFASGGADKTVIIWSSAGQGLLKFTHSSPIQALAYNPVTQQLASASQTDFGLWSPEVRSVPKTALTSRALCVAWGADGQYMAIGCEDGSVFIKDKAGRDQATIQKKGPVWSVAFPPHPLDKIRALVVASWDGTLSYYKMDGESHGLKDVTLGYKPCAMSFSSNGNYLVVGGTGKKLQLFTAAGIFVSTLTTKSTWIWGVAVRPGLSSGLLNIACGTEDGSVCYESTAISTVHGLYKGNYAYRDMLTDVVIETLGGSHRVRIRCKDCVRKISVYEAMVAVQLLDCIAVYERAAAEGGGTSYQLKARMQYSRNCDLLVVSSSHLTICDKHKLRCFNFGGVQEMEWILEANVRYVKCLGGPRGCEGIMVACRDGRVHKVFMNNPFPCHVWRHPKPIRYADISVGSTGLAVIDDDSKLTVINLLSGVIRYEEPNVTSVAFNQDHEGTLAYSGQQTLCVRTGSHRPSRQRLNSLVVAFHGTTVYCLQNQQLLQQEVALGGTVEQLMDAGKWAEAFKLACLGVPMEVWDALANGALLALDLDVARRAFCRTQNFLMLNLVHRLTIMRQAAVHDSILVGEVLAHQGKYEDAAHAFAKANAADRVLELWTDLRQFDKATKWAQMIGYGNASVDALRVQQAQWNEEVRDYKAAAEVYMGSGQYEKAVNLLARNTMDWSYLLQVTRKLDSETGRKALQQAALALLKHDQVEFAQEVMLKLEDWPALVQLHCNAEAWDRAFMTVKRCPDDEPALFETYAEWLVTRGRYDEARQAFAESTKPYMAARILEDLCASALKRQDFKEAAYYCYQMAQEILMAVHRPPSKLKASDKRRLNLFSEMYRTSELYYAYEIVHRAVSTPVGSETPRVVLNAACFLCTRLIHGSPPEGILLSHVVYILAQAASTQGNWKLARTAHLKLQALKIPRSWQARSDIESVNIRAHPLTNSDQHAQQCWRCAAAIPLLSANDACPTCGSAIIRSFVTFEPLPVIEFELADGISDEEAARWLAAEPRWPGATSTRHQQSDAREMRRQDADVLRLDEPEDSVRDEDLDYEDPFAAQMNIPNIPIRAESEMLRNLSQAEVLVRRWPNPAIPAQYFRLMDPLADIQIGSCGHFFEADEYEMMSLMWNRRPFSWDSLGGSTERIASAEMNRC
eukprot:jgi/Ulvmu1/3110/UM015_0150.1